MNKNKSAGFTLIELIITVAIVGILTAVAYPSYLEQIFKSKRATAAQSVLECVAILERRYTLNATYESDACDQVTNDDYALTVTVTGLTRQGRNCTANGRENCFLVVATANGSEDDRCQTMSLDERGIKEAKKGDGSSISTEQCWRTS